MSVATHVDDIITRGARAATVEVWTMVAARFPVKEWNIVEFDNPVHGHGVAHMSCGHSHAYSDVSLYCLQFAWHVSGGKCKFRIPVD